jgi:hypothetical protein
LSPNHLDGVWFWLSATDHFASASRFAVVTLTMPNGLSWKNVDCQPSLIEMLDIDGTTSKGGDELDLRMVEEVVVATGKSGVGLLFNLEDDVARNDTGSLVSLATELDLGTALDTTINMDMKDLAIDNSLLAQALFAAVLILEYFSLAVAVGADRLESLDHGTHLAHHRLHTVTVAARAPPDRTLLATATLALRADDRALKCELGDLSSVNVFKRDVVSVKDSLRLLRTTLMVHAAEHAAEATAEATTAEKLGKEVLRRHAAATGTTFKTRLAILVVDLALLRVGENLIGVRDLLELFFRSGIVCVLIWKRASAPSQDGKVYAKLTRVVLESILLVRLLQLLLCRRGRNLLWLLDCVEEVSVRRVPYAQGVVEFSLFDHGDALICLAR